MPDKHPPTLLGATAFKPVERHGMEAISWFLYDRKTGAIMGRTCKSWALITVFYIIYYSCLAAFWALSMYVFMKSTINDQQPRWLEDNGIIGKSPGIGVRPSQSDALLDSGMFVFNHQQKEDKDGIEGWGGWVQRTQDFLDETYLDHAEDCIDHCENKEGCNPAEKYQNFCKYLPNNQEDCTERCENKRKIREDCIAKNCQNKEGCRLDEKMENLLSEILTKSSQLNNKCKRCIAEHCKNKKGCNLAEKKENICKHLPKRGAPVKHQYLKKLDSNGNPETEDDKISAGDRKESFYHFDRSRLGECTKENNFGFSAGKPCILLKLNKIYGVEHDYFNNVTKAEKKLKEKKLPGLPEGLKKHINSKAYKDHVWVDCHGENPYDNEMLGDNGVMYYPNSRGFSSVFYPYENAPGYQTPLVAVQFLNLKPGHLYHIECRAYAGNIKYDRNDREGKAHFEIMMHNQHTADCVKNDDTCKKRSILL